MSEDTGGLLRKTGISAVGDVPWGTHFCQFYETREDLVDILVPYFKAGLENNEFCMWVTAEPLKTVSARNALRRAVPDLDSYIRKGQIEILPHDRWYLRGGSFDADHVLQGWVDKMNAAIAKGFSGLRLTGNTFWLEKGDWDAFTAYEAKVNSVIGQFKMLAICTYSLEKCDAADIMDVVKNHEFALVKHGDKWDRIESHEQAESRAALAASEERYHSLFSSMTEGMAQHEIILDAAGKPVDYRFLEVNDAFGRLTGLTSELVKGKTVREVIPGIEDFWIETYGKVALTGESTSFENHSAPLGKWFDVRAYSPKRGHFVAVFSDITDRKRAEAALARSVREWQSTFDSIDDMVSIQDTQYRFVRVNKAFARALGREPEELIGQVCYEQVHRLHAPLGMCPHTQTLATGKSATSEFYEPSLKAYLEVTTSPLLDENGKVIGSAHVARDITQRRKTEDALKARERLLQRMAELNPAIVSVSEIGGKEIYASKSTMDLLGYSAEVVRGTPNFTVSIVHPDDYQRLLEVAGEIGQLSDNKARSIEIRIKDVKGNWRWFRVQYVVFEKDADGLPTQVMSVSQDITDLKQADEALRETTSYLQNLIDYANAPIITWDPLFRITRFNHAFERLTGLAAGDVLGKTLDILFPAATRDESMNLIRKTQSGERWEVVEIPILRRDGAVRTVLWNSATLVDESGKPTATIAQGQDITERKRAEEALREAAVRYRTVADNTYDFEFWINPQGEYLWASPSSERIYGYKPAEFIADPGLRRRVICPDDLAAFDSHVSEEAGKARAEVEYRVIRPDGAIRWIAHVCQPVFDEHGKYLGVRGTNRDITERKQAEEVLRETTSYLQNLIDYANAPIITWDPAFRITRFNHAFERLTGLAAGDVLGKTLDILFPAATRTESMDLIRKTQAGERWEVVEIPILHRDASVRTVLWNSATIFDDLNRPTATIAQGQDITERKQAEEVLRETTSYLQNLIDHANAPIITWDPEFRITRFSHAFERLTGLAAGDVLGKTLDILFPTATRDESMDLIRKTQSGERWEVVEIPILHRDGAVRTVLWNSATIFDDLGKPAATIAQGQDITERKRAEETLVLRSEELARSNRELEQFAYIASHDLQEPLRMVSSYVQLLRSRYAGKLDQDADDFIGFAFDGATRMQRLINDLLAYSRVGTRGKAFGRVRLQDTLDQAIDNLKVTIEEHKAVISHDPLPVITADEGQMVQLLQNLIDNAIKFHGDMPPEVHITARIKDGYWFCSVRDNGIGIAPKYRERIFEIFQRLHSRDKYPGTGIGLAVCKRIVERHGGEIWADSEEGKGSVFYFTIPVKEGDSVNQQP